MSMSTLAHDTGPSAVLSRQVPHNSFPWRALAPVAMTAVLALGSTIPGMNMLQFALSLAFTGVLFIAVFLVIGLPWMAMLG